MKLAIVHDLAESIVGDITPSCGVSKAEKYAREDVSWLNFYLLVVPLERHRFIWITSMQIDEEPVTCLL